MGIKPIGRFEKIIGLIFLLTLITGVLRKWVFEYGIVANSILAFQLCIPYILIFAGTAYKKPWQYSIIALYGILLIYMAINPLNLTYYHGVLGFILHFGFWFFLGYYFANREKINFRPIIPLFVICSFVEIVVGFIQYQLPPDNVLNKYAYLDAVEGIALVGGAVRITGTFAYIGGYTAFTAFLIFFIWYLFIIRYNAILLSILYTGGLIASFMTGSRASTGVYLIISCLMIFSEFSWNKVKTFIGNLIIPLILLFSIVLLKGNIGIEDVISKAYENFSNRVEENRNSGEQRGRIIWDFEDLSNFRGKYPVAGLGLGSTYQGATIVFGTSDYVKEYGYYENELTRIVVEGGFILFFFRLILVAFFVNLLQMNTISKLVIFSLIFYFIPIVFNIYNSIFFAIGLILVDNAKYSVKIKYT